MNDARDLGPRGMGALYTKAGGRRVVCLSERSSGNFGPRAGLTRYSVGARVAPVYLHACA